jgi:GH18 family chitinase
LRPSLKLLIAVGGWTAASEAFNHVVTNATTRSLFIQHTKSFLQEWNFDGIDLVRERLDGHATEDD